MAKASRAYTGSRQSVGAVTLNKNSYMFMMKMIRKEMEKKHAKGKTDVPAGAGAAEGEISG